MRSVFRSSSLRWNIREIGFGNANRRQEPTTVPYNVSAQADDVDVTKTRLIVFSDASFGRDVNRSGIRSMAQHAERKFVPLSVSSVCLHSFMHACEVEVYGIVMMLKEAEFDSQVCVFAGATFTAPTVCIMDNKRPHAM